MYFRKITYAENFKWNKSIINAHSFHSKAHPSFYNDTNTHNFPRKKIIHIYQRNRAVDFVPLALELGFSLRTFRQQNRANFILSVHSYTWRSTITLLFSTVKNQNFHLKRRTAALAHLSLLLWRKNLITCFYKRRIKISYFKDFLILRSVSFLLLKYLFLCFGVHINH